MENFKKITTIVFVFLLIISSTLAMLTGCGAKNSEEANNPAVESDLTSEIENQAIEEEATEIEEQVVNTEADNEIESQNEANNQTEKKVIGEIEAAIISIIEAQNKAIIGKDREAYMGTINPNDTILVSDSNTWSYRLSKADIKNFSLELNEILLEEEEKIVASVHLKYTVNENEYDLTYPVKFEKINNKWYCSGPDYKEKNNGNLRLLYFEKDEEYAEMIMDAAIEGYDTVLNSLNLKDSIKITMKYYDNSDWLRQFSYPTYVRKFLAWSAGDGNISLTYNEKAENEEELKYSFKNTLTHEFTHEITYAIANYSSFPQWLFEGLAEYYAGPSLHSIPYEELRLWTIEELDSDAFYELTDKTEVRSFYYTGARIVEYLIDKYGEKKIVQLLTAISESELPDEKWMERFIQVFEETYEITYDEFKKEWSKFIEN